MAGRINLKFLTHFFNTIGPLRRLVRRKKMSDFSGLEPRLTGPSRSRSS